MSLKHLEQIRTQKVRDRIWVQWQGRLYSIAADPRKARTAAHGDESQELIAPFSCKVLKVQVKDGQSVKKGDPIVVVEAMKMEYTYTSPRDGLIARVLAREGEIIQGGAAFVAWKE